MSKVSISRVVENIRASTTVDTSVVDTIVMPSKPLTKPAEQVGKSRFVRTAVVSRNRVSWSYMG